jgi:hypothetical protein
MKQSDTKKRQDSAVEKPTRRRPDSGMEVVKTAEQSTGEMINALQQSTGIHNRRVAERMVSQVLDVLFSPTQADEDGNDILATATSLLKEMAPQNAIEGMLATQMIATNDAALTFVKRATLDDQTVEGADANVLRATRLLRVFVLQAEAMQKLRAKPSQQTVTVEQVNVHQGGQAIVGSVSASKEGG